MLNRLAPAPLPFDRCAEPQDRALLVCSERAQALSPRGAMGLDAPERRLPANKKEERPRPKPGPLRKGSGALLDALVREADDMQRDAGLPQFLGEVLLDA